jgi:hypothetical protein
MASVQFSLCVEHTVAADGVVVVPGDGLVGAGAGAGEDATRGLSARQYG